MKTIIHRDGTVLYYGPIMDIKQADYYLNELLQQVEWKNDELIMFGKRIVTKRKTAWYGEKGLYYTYSGVTRYTLPWLGILEQLKQVVEKTTADTYNSCLLNLYHNGSEGMSWHSDDEPDLKENGTIASLSFGAKRKFSFRHKTTKEKIDLFLEHGSLLTMKGGTQKHWLHRLSPTRLCVDKRINITFRTIITVRK